MIGQHNLQSRISALIKFNAYPRFTILVGAPGSGKRTLANEISKWLQKDELACSFICPDVKVDTIREIISGAYKIGGTNIYIIPDADNMSTGAKNALLKVTEEPPNDAYFIMTLEDENNTLETIKSRATIFHMDRYTPDEIEEYYRNKFCLSETTIALERKEISIVRDLCETPGDVESIMKYDATNFYDYVQLVVDNIKEVSLANALKISSKIALKDGEEGYDLRLFWKTFIEVCFTRMRIDDVMITSKWLRKLKVPRVNKLMLFDSWVLDLRNEL